MNQLTKRAVLMRLSIGLPGQQKQDDALTGEVKQEHGLGEKAGKWVKELYPPEALQNIKQLDNKAAAFHESLTLPFSKGIGILTSALIPHYADRMRQFKSQRENLIESVFLSNPQRWIDWASTTHNGTFEPELYPGCSHDKVDGEWVVDADAFRSAMRQKFYFRTEPIPVPDSAHFESSVKELLGLDDASYNREIQDKAKDAQRVLFKRMMEPVQKMVEVLNKEKPRIYDSMIGNIKEIAELVPAMNLSDDPQLNAFASDMAKIAKAFTPDGLRKSEGDRDKAQREAEELMKRLSAYKL